MSLNSQLVIRATVCWVSVPRECVTNETVGTAFFINQLKNNSLLKISDTEWNKMKQRISQ